jgi:hypothetical protein
MNCKTCKNWTVAQKTDNDGWAFHYYIPENPTDTEFGICDKIIYTGNGGEAEKDISNPNDVVIYSDNEAYAAYCLTGQNFGCVHYQPNESKKG